MDDGPEKIIGGQQIGQYRIIRQIGRGGMGEVYLAQDERLGRQIALKLLPAQFTGEQDRMRRFQQEARATSALNHPNILTVHEVGEFQGRHFMATEFIEGVTLRQHLNSTEINIREALDIAVQVASALTAAHAAGIVHRDIKPENVMLRTDGYVKVLDFGLAKLTPISNKLADPNMSTAPNIDTEPHAVVGTVVYMSPEQLRGMNVDGRTDIWSLGVLIYEMIAGRPPFSGTTKSDVIASILREEPLPLMRFSMDVSPDSVRIFDKCLRKNREERYQIAKDLLIDLKDLKQELEIRAKLGRVSSSSAISEAQTERLAEEPATSDAPAERATTSDIQPAPWTSGVEHISLAIRRHPVGATALLVLLIVILTAAAVWFSVIRPRSEAPAGSTSPLLTEIMTTSDVREATISPDGKYIATVVEDAGKQSIRIQPAANSNVSSIVADGNEYRGLVFSRDGYSVYYLQRDHKGTALYRVSALGGAQRKLIDNIDSPVALSPDGSQLAFVRKKASGAGLIVANTEGADERELTTSTERHAFGTLISLNNGPAWSPDGKLIAYPIINGDEASLMDVFTVRVADGFVQPVGTRHWCLIGQLGWLADGSGLIMDAQEKPPPITTPQIWYLGFPSGEARSLTSDLSYYHGISLTADSSTLITTSELQSSNIWIVSGPQWNQVEKLVTSQNKGSGGLAWTPDEKIIYATHESGWQQIWTMEASGNNSMQLTFDKRTNVEPAIPQSNYNHAVFASYEAAQPHIWRMDPNGRDLKRLTDGVYEDWPDVSPDGQWVVYHSKSSSTERVMKVSINGGQTSVLIDKPARHPVFSPDGKFVACYLNDEGEAWRLAILPFDGGEPLKTFDVPLSVTLQWHGPRWMPNSQEVTYIVTRGGVSNIWTQPLSSGPPRQLTNFNEDEIFAFAWSRDGKKIGCVRGADTKSVVLFKNFLGN